MRVDFRRQLDSLRADLGDMCRLAGDAMASATSGLLATDAEAARRVGDVVERLGLLHHDVERRTLGILARQAPVAHDLRRVVTAIHIAADADRMGGLARHVARVSLRRHPDPAIPDEMRGQFQEMGRLAVGLAEQCVGVLLAGDDAQISQVRDDDQAMETVHRTLFAAVTGPQWAHGAGMASDVVLLGRFYGRFADHADEIARRMIFQSSGRSVTREYVV